MDWKTEYREYEILSARGYGSYIEELEAERYEALNQLDSARHSVEVLEVNVARLEWALQELFADPAITVAEHVQEDKGDA